MADCLKNYKWFKNCATTAIVNSQAIFQIGWGGGFWGARE